MKNNMNQIQNYDLEMAKEERGLKRLFAYREKLGMISPEAVELVKEQEKE